MRNKIFAVIMVLACLLLAGNIQAVEDKPQMGVSLNASHNLNANMDLVANMCFINLMSGYSPYTSLGLSYKFNDRFSLSGYVGYGFEPQDSGDIGWFWGFDPTLKFGDWVLAQSFYYYAGFNVLFTFHSLTYPVGFTRAGIDIRNYHYLEKVDEGSRSYQIGPSLKIPFNDKMALKLNYYYAFEPYGEPLMDSNVYKATLIYNF